VTTSPAGGHGAFKRAYRAFRGDSVTTSPAGGHGGRSGGDSVTTVLIVEDNPRNLKLVRDVLGHAGYATLEAADGEAALAIAREQRPDAILMDINLPGMTGLEALAALRADAATAAIPVAALTAYAMKDDRARILAAGFDGYLEKPVDVRALPAQIEALLQR
jgi:two-component system, cell cycle response regulator DivK